MRSSKTVHAYASRLLCLGVAFTLLAIADCGGGGSGTTRNPQTPVITWNTPAAITYGTALSNTQLDATANVAGAFTYDPAVGATPKAGTQTLSASFTPQDTLDYTAADKNVQLTINQATPTITTPPTAAAITSGAALSASTLSGGAASFSGSPVPGSFAWTSAATVPAVGTDSESVTFTPTDATDYTTATVNVPVVVNAPAPTVAISASPTTITLGDTTTLTWSSTNATSCAASGAWSGAEATSGSATETPTATGTPKYTLKCTGANGSATASATVTVNTAPLPNVGSVVPNTIYREQEAIIANIQVNGSNFQRQDVLVSNPNANISGVQLSSSSQLEFNIGLDTPHFSPGLITLGVCENTNGTNCGTSGALAFLGARNYLAVSPNGGELYFLDQAQGAPAGQNGYVRKYKADGTPDGSCFIGGLIHSIAFDSTTNYLVADGVPYYPSGPNFGTTNGGTCDFTDVPNPQKFPSGTVLASATDNGYAGLVQPANNSASFYDMTGGAGSQPTVYTASNLGSYPDPIAMATFGTETDGFIVSLNDTPSPLLHLVRVVDAYAGERLALALTGITPMSAVLAANPTAGGVQVVAFDSGFAIGTVAVLSTYDKAIVFVDEATWTITRSVKFSGVPIRIVADDIDGTVIVAFANLAGSTATTYEAVDALSGAITPLANASFLLSVGIGVSSDGTKIYSGQRDQLDVFANQ